MSEFEKKDFSLPQSSSLFILSLLFFLLFLLLMLIFILFLYPPNFYQFSSVTQSCLTLCNPMDCSTPGFPAHHQLLELAQTHIH